MFTYRKILSKAWQITWQNPILWFFGFFLALLGVGGEIEILLGSVALGENQAVLLSLFTGLAEGGLFSPTGLLGLANTLINRPFNFISLLIWLITLLILALVVIWLVVVSQGALIKGVVNIIKRKATSWAQHFEFGLATFWPVLTLNILAKLIFSSLFIILGYLALASFSAAATIFIIAFIIFVGIIVIVSFVTKYAICAVVLRRQSAGDSIDLAVKLLRKNWLLSLEVATILFFIYWLTTILLINLLSSFFVSTLRVFGSQGSVALVAFIIVLLITVVIQILLAIFHWSAWVLVFELLTSKEETLKSHLINWFKKIVER